MQPLNMHNINDIPSSQKNILPVKTLPPHVRPRETSPYGLPPLVTALPT